MKYPYTRTGNACTHMHTTGQYRTAIPQAGMLADACPFALHAHATCVWHVCRVSGYACMCMRRYTHTFTCVRSQRASKCTEEKKRGGRERERERERERPALALMGTEGGAFALLAVCPLPLVLADARPFAADEKKKNSRRQPRLSKSNSSLFFSFRRGGKRREKEKKIKIKRKRKRRRKNPG